MTGERVCVSPSSISPSHFPHFRIFSAHLLTLSLVVQPWRRDCQGSRQEEGHSKYMVLYARSVSTNTSGVCLLVACLTSQQHASIFQERICSDKCTCCHTEVEVADQIFYLTQSRYADTVPANFSITGVTRSEKKSPWRERESNIGSSVLEADALTTRPRRHKKTWPSKDVTTIVVAIIVIIKLPQDIVQCSHILRSHTLVTLSCVK